MAAFPYTNSFWASPVAPRTPLGSATALADVVIVGGGYAGMSSAYYLKKAKPDLKVVLLEKDHIGFGPSGRNFGAVVPGLRELRTALLGDIDLEEEKFVQQWYLAARGELERRIAEGGIECEYRNEPILMQALDESTWEAQKREAEILRAKGTPHLLLDAAAFRKAMAVPYQVYGGIVRTAWRAVQPFKLARGLGEQLRALGVTVHEATAVTDVDDRGSEVVVKTSDGGVVRAGKAVLAANAYSQFLAPVADMIFPRHSWVLATRPLADDVLNSLGFNAYKFAEDAGMTFYYTRIYKNRLLIGGGPASKGIFTPSTIDRTADQDAEEYARVYDEMQRRFPQLRGAEIEAAWGGPIDMTDNFMPIIKPLPGKPNLIACFGFNGEGLLNGNISGKFVQGLVLGPGFVDADAERIRHYMARA
ncbi:MAG: FAD-dependent oxidoreductase [Hyphomonadaceae bacterium]